MLSDYSVRKYKIGDIEQVVNVYKRSVEEIGPEKYSPEQVRVWASYPDNIIEFNRALKSGYTLVAESSEGEIASFGSITSAAHISLMFTLKEHTGKGIAGFIYRKLEEYAIEKGGKHITTEASLIALPFFEKQGFKVLEKETVERQGIALDRYKMEKNLS